MKVFITDHARDRATERLGWSCDDVEDRLRAITLKAASLDPIAGIEEMRLKIDGVTFVCALHKESVVVVTVIG